MGAYSYRDEDLKRLYEDLLKECGIDPELYPIDLSTRAPLTGIFAEALALLAEGTRARTGRRDVDGNLIDPNGVGEMKP